MKVITEDVLKNKYEEAKQNYLYCDQMHMYGESRVIAAIEDLMQKMQEIDAVTVAKLRPMCDAPKNGEFLVMLNTEDDLHECSFALDGRIRIGSMLFRVEYCIGWVPKPIYKPELTGDGE